MGELKHRVRSEKWEGECPIISNQVRAVALSLTTQVKIMAKRCLIQVIWEKFNTFTNDATKWGRNLKLKEMSFSLPCLVFIQSNFALKLLTFCYSIFFPSQKRHKQLSKCWEIASGSKLLVYSTVNFSKLAE